MDKLKSVTANLTEKDMSDLRNPFVSAERYVEIKAKLKENN